MTRVGQVASGLIALACIAGLGRTAGAATLDPFRAGAAAGKARALDPFRVAQALPGPQEEEKPAPKAAPAKPQAPAPATSTPSPAPTPTPTTTPGAASTTTPAAAAPATAAAAAPPAKACQRDEDCPEGNICQASVCQRIELSTNLFPIYYREGSFKEIALVYWSRKGNPGYTVAFPFYWHFYSPTTDALLVAPFYWHSTDSARGYDLKVVLNVSWSSEPGARSFAIWPLFYGSNKFGWAIPFLLTFNVGDSKTGSQYGAFAGLYWWKRSQAGAFDLGFVPPYVSSRDAAGAFTWAAPLNFYWRNADDRNLLALPLFFKNVHKTGNSVYTWLGYSKREGLEQSGSAFWLYWYGKDDADKSRYDVLFPLLWSFRAGASRNTVFFPLLWSFSSPKSSTTVVFPLYLGYRSGSSYFKTVFPLWWSRGDVDTGRSFKLLFPFFFWQKDAKARTSTLVTLPYSFSRDRTAGTFSGFILPLLTYWHREPQSEFNFVTPLYVSHYSKTNHSMTRVIGLIGYRREDPEGTTTALFPLFWRFRDAATGASATLLVPIGGYRSGPRDETLVIGPFYWRTYKPEGWNAGLFPLAMFGSNKGTRHAIVFPLFWHFAGQQSSTTALVPLFYWHRDPDGYALGTPLYFAGNDRGERYKVLFPLLWHFASERRGTSTTVTPLGYIHTDPDGWSLGAGPIVPLLFARSGKQRSHFALFPLFWHFSDRAADKQTTVAALYWHRRWGGETTDALFPLFHYRRGARPGGSDETSFTLLPLVHYRRDANSKVLVTPLYASARGPERSAGFAGPYIWYDDKELSLRFVPFLHTDVTNHETHERTRQFGPWFTMDAPGRRARVLFPLFGTYTDERETDTWVVPTYFRMRRNNGDRVDALLPFYWKSTLGDRTTTVIGPFYHRAAPGVENFGVVPLFFYARNPERSLTVIPPLLSYRRNEHDGEKVRQLTLLYFHKHDKETSLTTLFPLFWSYKRGAKETAVGFPLYWHVADAKAARSWSAFLPLAFWSRSGTWRTRGILSAWYTRDAASGYAANAFLPLFYQASGPDHFALLTLAGGYRRSGPSQTWYATPLIWSHDSVQTRFSMAFPLWFRRTDKARERTTTVIPPLLYGSRTSPAESFTTALALFWRFRDIASATTVVLPLFYDVHDYQLSRTTALFPFFVRHHREADQTTYWVSPFFYSHKEPGYETTFGAPAVFLPLYWKIQRGESKTTVVLPIYAHWQRPGYRSTLVVPSYYYQEGLHENGAPDGTYRRFVGLVLPFYDSGVKRPGDFMWNLLGGLVGRERIGHHRYLRLFWFINVETESAPRAQTAWYSQPVRAPRKMAARGLDVAGF